MGCCAAVPQENVYVVETCGDFKQFLYPGCGCIGCFPFNYVRGSLNSRLKSRDLQCVAKTKTNVFVVMRLSIQYEIIQEKLELAYYTLDDPESHLASLVFDAVTSIVPKIELDDLFETRDDISKFVKQSLSEGMESYGYRIVDVLLTNVSPDKDVQESMNNINRLRRLRIAETEIAEYQRSWATRMQMKRMRIVKAAEAEMIQMQLKGEGLARQRQILVEGLKDSLVEALPQLGLEQKSVMELILLSQYLDTLKDVGKNSGSNIVFYDDGDDDSGLTNLRNIMVQSNSAASK
ncbi:hypothetical protein IE077_001019 [Cardiosporidium cionae]|uniref:Band 7 domain-containing protein n=1 Tax=Cardiosporidium cionae TaxID=476202 RepID=A0ABQ7JDP7_9APIC|nr:hypothetical protein IE077_001019 [Cardiosporidium cionae]|eukprot:KAF8822106.1 hypothetical protein IE077_001019 [Cardiosporidium cionae]